MAFIESTYQTIQKRKLILKKTLVVVAVSGGADSLALLHVLVHLREKLDCALHVATLDHGLRGAAGAADADFVAETARAWGLPVTRGQVNTAEYAAGVGIEAAARAARYDFLAQVAHEVGADRIAAAHHADDQAETVLLRLLRGAGTAGLRAMTWTAPVPGHADLKLIRPFLETTRAEIEAYCRDHNLSPRQDATNADTSLLRNRVRHEVLPMLAQINPQISRALLHLSQTAAVDDDFWRQAVNQAVERSGAISMDRAHADRRTFRDWHPALQRRWVYTAARALGGMEIDFEHILEAVEQAQRGHTGAETILPGGLRLRVDYDAVIIERADAAPPVPDQPLLPTGAEIAVSIPGITPLPESGWQIETAWTALPDSVAISTPRADLILRTRRSGDRFAPPGLSGHTQSLKKWMIDHKIPRALRERLPLLIIDGHIAAVVVWPRLILSEEPFSDNHDPLFLYVKFTNVKKY